MGKRELKKMGIMDLGFLDEVAAIKLDHPEWDMKKIGSFLRSKKKITVTSRELRQVLEECENLFSSKKADLPSKVTTVNGYSNNEGKSLSHWGWFTW